MHLDVLKTCLETCIDMLFLVARPATNSVDTCASTFVLACTCPPWCVYHGLSTEQFIGHFGSRVMVHGTANVHQAQITPRWTHPPPRVPLLRGGGAHEQVQENPALKCE